MRVEMFELFRDVGRDLFVAGAVTARHGNLSMRFGDRIIITRSGSMLSRLEPDDVMETSMQPSVSDAGCSRELVVHRAVYQATGAQAICHAHPPHTMFRSLVDDVIRPLDSEAGCVIGAEVPVLAPEQAIGSAEAGQLLAQALQHVPIAVLRTHGPFAIGETLWDAWGLIGVLEESCHILDLRDGCGLPLR
ncbi:MAG: class II aldolase/adducin family protein [Coriobacteriia bacterium]|nr:class II aldolase/adducin family protein [Coriobacteriia bacterium]